ncbi:MAG: hypothetical protein Q8N63_09225 [Nanoarchaeota archaeon]|nr:hypothetical protein [Nanoarchaeota archaeon]
MIAKVIKENIIKNIFLTLVLIYVYFSAKQYFMNILNDKSVAGDILIAVSIIIVTACFGNFAFTYEKINIKNTFERYFAHLLTAILILIIGIHLILTQLLVSFIIGHIILIDITLLLLYVACIGYDFFDLIKVMHHSYKV